MYVCATRVAMAAVCAALLASCSGSAVQTPAPTASPRATPSPPDSGPTLSGTVITSEDVSLTAPFRTPVQVLADQEPTPAPTVSCGQYAAGVAGSFVAPVFTITSGEHGLYFDGMMLSGYHGPGTYDSSRDLSLGGTISVTVGVGAATQPTYSIFRSHINGRSSMTVRPDGSGTFEFDGWGSDEVRGTTGSAASVSGTVDWTCG